MLHTREVRQSEFHSAWLDYGRWIIVAVSIVAVVLIGLFACIIYRRRRTRVFHDLECREVQHFRDDSLSDVDPPQTAARSPLFIRD